MGGGFAALEAMFALHALAGERADVVMVSDTDELGYRPLSVFSARGAEDVPRWSLPDLAAQAGARFRRDRIVAVAKQARRVRTASGAVLDYDALILAVGTRARSGVPGAMTFRDHRDAATLQRRIDRVADEDGAIAFCSPGPSSWTLPLYELALLAADELRERGSAATVTVITPERAPADIFGPVGSDAITDALVERDVRILAGERPLAVGAEGVRLRDGGTVPATFAVAMPRLVAPAIAGVPGDFNGLVPVDEAGRVTGMSGVYAAGDMTAFPVKQGGIGAQQAEDAARDIARAAGVDCPPPSGTRVLRARLAGTDPPLMLRSVLDATGRPVGDGSAEEVAPPALWAEAKVFGRFLAPRLAAQQAGV